jgi:Malectin domain
MEVVNCIVVVILLSACSGYEIHYAVNFGNVGAFTDSQGIVYEQEASSYGKGTVGQKISGADDHDQKLYQSYSADSKQLFHYIFDIKVSGRYLLVFKIFADSSARKLNLILNEKHQAVTNLSAYDEVGTNAAYDEYVYFSVCDDHLLYKNQKSVIKNNKISVNFQSAVSNSNLIMSAMILVRADVENFPILLNRQSKDAEISQLYQQLVHSCAKKPDAEVELIPKKVKPQKSIVEPLVQRYGLNLLMSNFTIGNMNVYPAIDHLEKEKDLLAEDER